MSQIDGYPGLISDMLKSKIIKLRNEDVDKTVLVNMNKAVERSKGRIVLFLGAAISSFKPAQLPVWLEYLKMLWKSCIDTAYAGDKLSESLNKFFDDGIKTSRIEYPMVTETIARRLGKDYLKVLEAFEADFQNGAWPVNNIHRRFAEYLSSGQVASVMTTNFDNYLERALEVIGANYYKVTGTHETDDIEISKRMPTSTSSKKLVLVVNGSKAFAFARSLMPQLGAGKITFLFKLHGSCYDPPGCVDTHLQRVQGLPASCTDILDTLLKRAVWLVAGFSGADMNENLDYLRFLSNAKQARIFWSSYSAPTSNSAVDRLVARLPSNAGETTGMSCFLMSLEGERIGGGDKFTQFEGKIADWSKGLGKEWCKLILVDLIMLFVSQLSAPGDKGIVDEGRALGSQILSNTQLRQDWNEILRSMKSEGAEEQFSAAQSCSEMCSTLSELNFILDGLDPVKIERICKTLDEAVTRLQSFQYDFHSDTMHSREEPLHAQSWVLGSLCGLAMLIGNHPQAAKQAFERSSSLALLVGDDQTEKLVGDFIKIALSQSDLSLSFQELNVEAKNEKVFSVFSPAIDNVSSKTTEDGIPPRVYAQALLHRSLMFADGLAINASVIANSTVFVNEVLFQGAEVNKIDDVYLQHIILSLPDVLKNKPKKLTEYLSTRDLKFIHEHVNPAHITFLDNYFDEPEHQHQILYYNQDNLMQSYATHLRCQVDADHRSATVQHLVNQWTSTSEGDFTQHDRHDDVVAAAEDLTKSLSLLLELMEETGSLPTRSALYRFADLFDETSDDPRKVVKDLIPDIKDSDYHTLVEAYHRIVGRPWLYGPLCHELIDVPYQANILLSLLTSRHENSYVFLEDSQPDSWMFTTGIRNSMTKSTLRMTPPASGVEQHLSAVLLSQVSKEDLLETRKQLTTVRAKASEGGVLSKEDLNVAHKLIEACSSGPRKFPDVDITSLVELNEDVKIAARQLLKHCTFIVRKGGALDPMYGEGAITVPGLFTLTIDQ